MKIDVNDWKRIKQELLKTFRKRLPSQDRKPSREYRSPEGYLDHEYLHCLKQMSFFEVEKNEIWRGLSIATLGLQDLEIDPYYLSKDILRYLVNTDYPSTSISLQETYPLLEVVIPTGELLDDQGDSIVLLIIVDYFLWRDMARANLLRSMWQNEPTSYRYGIYGLCEHGAVFYTPVQTKEEDQVAAGEVVISNGKVVDVLQAVKSIGINLMILLKEYPEYVTIQASAPYNTSGFGLASKQNTKKSSKLDPKVIGVDFNTKVTVERPSNNVKLNPSTQKKNPSKRAHFRRGHWRRQRKGQRLVDHEYVWIKPVFIG
jgi:hypothetical protein